MSSASHNLRKIARVLKSNGTEGEILASFSGFDPEDINLKEPVFIVFDGLPVPFYIQSIAARGKNRALIRLADISNLEDADEISGKDLFVDTCSAEYEPEKDMLVGWTLLRDSGAKAGTVTGFLDIPENPCLEIEHEKGTAIIPFHENLVISVNPESREIEMIIPEGLI